MNRRTLVANTNLAALIFGIGLRQSKPSRGRSAGVMVEWQELVEIAVRPAVGDALKRFREPSEGIDAVHFGGLQKRCDRLCRILVRRPVGREGRRYRKYVARASGARGNRDGRSKA
jgi:hypothetical protein